MPHPQIVSTGSGTNAQPAQLDDFTRSFREMRGDEDIQFAPVPLPEREPSPDWLRDFFEWLRDFLSPLGDALAGSWPFLKWALIIGGIALLVLLLWRIFGPDLLARKSERAPVEEWVPDQAAVLALLEDADRLAAQGRYDEATHLLLQRSVGQIAEARPDLVEPSSTAREIAAEPALPEGARNAFGIIAQRVERSLFALRSLNADDWQAARSAYADFALTQNELGQRALAA